MSTEPKPRNIDNIERDQLTSPFGRDWGLIHEVVLRIRNKQNLGRALWRLLQENDGALHRAMEAALSFPTYKCKLEGALESLDELVLRCNKVEKQSWERDPYSIMFNGTLRADEGGNVEYADPEIDITIFPTSRETSLRDVEEQLAGLHFRPARMAETLLFAAQHRNRKDYGPERVVCLQRGFLNERETRLEVREVGRFHKGHQFSIDTLSSDSLSKYQSGHLPAGVGIPCVRLPRLKK